MLLLEKLRPPATLGSVLNSIRQRRPQRGFILSQAVGRGDAGVAAGSVFSRLAVRGGATWTPQRLAWSGLLMAVGEQASLTERFRAVCECLHAACPHWTLGTSYDNWVAAQRREAERLVPAVTGKLRQHMLALVEHRRRCGRWEAFAVDGSDAACPRTLANQDAMGDTGKPDGIPQLTMTVLYHMGLGLPWAFRVGPSSESERGQLRQMLDELPAESLLVADAGFIGYDLCREMIDRKQHFLLRVGGNVHLLSTLGYDYEIDGETVYLWPVEQQARGQPPLVLRLIVVHEPGKQPVYLVTSVLDAKQLTAEEAAEIYRARWGVEVCYRTIKQTLGHAYTRSRRPDNCYLEMTWALLGAWLLELMTLRQVVATGGSPRDVSPAQARNAVRRALRDAPPRPRSRQPLLAVLAACRIDTYRRSRPKASRNYPRKKRHQPPEPPKIKLPTEKQLQQAKQLTPISLAN